MRFFLLLSLLLISLSLFVFLNYPLLSVVPLLLACALLFRRYAWFLTTYAAFFALVLTYGGTPGYLQHLLALSIISYILAVVFWSRGYILTALGIALSSVGYLTSSPPPYDVLYILGPYFAYLALLSWVAWRIGAGKFAYLVGSTSLVLQTIVDLFGTAQFFGKWPGAPLLSFSLIPLIVSNWSVNKMGRFGVAAFLTTAGGMAWGLFRLFAGHPQEFASGEYTLWLCAISILLISLLASPRRFVGGVMIAVGVYLLGMFLAPFSLQWLFSSLLPLLVIFTMSVLKPKPVITVLLLAAFALTLIYYWPLILTPPGYTKLTLGPVILKGEGYVYNGTNDVVKLVGVKLGVENGVARGVIELKTAGISLKEGLYLDLNMPEVVSREEVLYLFPHLLIMRIFVLEDIYKTYYLCNLGSALGVGCDGLYLSFLIEVYVYGNLLLYSLLWFCVLLSPLGVWYCWERCRILQRLLTKITSIFCVHKLYIKINRR